MSDRDELLFGAEVNDLRDTDSDGDGVTDMQERLDGTDPNDASSSIRHDLVNPLDSTDPRGDLNPLSLDGLTVVDVTANIPDGKSIEQSLPTGLDGQALPTGPNHHGNSMADGLLVEHGTSGLSPLDMQRSPLTETPAQNTFGLGNITTPGSDKGGSIGSNLMNGPPPGQGPSGSSDVGPNNMDLVSGKSDKSDKPFSDVAFVVARDVTTAAKDVLSIPGAIYDGIKEGLTTQTSGHIDPPTEPPEPPAPLPKAPKMSDPDAGDGGAGGPISEDDVARAVAVRGGATDVVRGAGPQIIDTAPPAKEGDLVTDKNPDGDVTAIVGTATVLPPGSQISHPVNPQDGLPPGHDPSPGGGQSGGDSSGAQGGAQGDGRVGVSSAATATDAGDTAADVTGVTAVGAGSSGGIHTIGSGTDDTTASTDVVADAASELVADVSVEVPLDVPLDVAAEVIPVPLDPVADAMGTFDAGAIDAPRDSFGVLEVDHDLAVPVEVDLDDGF